MKTKFVIGLDGSGVDEMIRGVREYRRWIERKSEELAKQLADKGYNIAYQIFAGHVFDGETIGSLHVEQRGPSTYAVMAASKAVLFVEFGSGIRGFGHPEPQGYGPGTYPGQTHALDPQGWWYPTDDPRLIVRTDKKGQGWGHSYGNPPAMPMYTAAKELDQDFSSVVREVFVT